MKLGNLVVVLFCPFKHCKTITTCSLYSFKMYIIFSGAACPDLSCAAFHLRRSKTLMPPIWAKKGPKL